MEDFLLDPSSAEEKPSLKETKAMNSVQTRKISPLELKAGSNSIFGRISNFDKNKQYKVHCKKVWSNDKVTEIIPQNQDFMIPCLEPNTQYSVQYGMKEGEDDYLWSESSEITTYRTKVRKTEKYDTLLAELRSFSLDDRICSLGLNRVNILLVGRIGAGKSSLICTIHSVFEGASNITIAPFGPSSTSFTQAFRKIPSKFNPHIWFYDIYGMEGNNLKDVLEPLLMGRLKEGHKKGDPVEKDLGTPSLLEQVHVVMLVVEQQTLSQDSEVDNLLLLLNQIRGYGLPTLIVLTKMDTLAKPPMPEIKPSDLGDHYAVLERLKVAKDKLKSQEIYPFINCTETFDEDSSRAQQALEILQRALQLGMSFIKDNKTIIEIRKDSHVLCSIQVDSLTANLSSIREEIERTVKVPFYFVKDGKHIDLQDVNKLTIADICTVHEIDNNVFVMQLDLLGDFNLSEELVEEQVIIQDEEGKSIDAIDNVRRKEKVSEFRKKIDEVIVEDQDYRIFTKNNKLLDKGQESSTLLESCLRGKEKDFKYLMIRLEKINLQIMTCEEIPVAHLVGLKSNSTLADVRLELEKDPKTKITFFAKPLKDGTRVKLKKVDMERNIKAKDLVIEENDVKYLYVYT